MPAVVPLAPVPLDPALNPGFLKLDLLCRGARLGEPGRVTAAGGRPLLRTRAGLGSGLELVLAHDLWVNVPVAERFAAASPWEVRLDDAAGRVTLLRDGRPVTRARLAPRPRWYDARGPGGRPLQRVATLQGTTLAVYPGRVCDFWVTSAARPQPERCRFCSVGLNLGADDAPEKGVDEVLAAVDAARRENDVTYVDFNAGHADDDGVLDRLEPYVRRVKRETGLLVGVQTPPHPDLSRFDRLRALGVNRVSFCFELFDPGRFEEVCPGKARVYGRARYLEAIEHCARPRRGPLGEPWVVNGELIAGLEDVRHSLAAVDWLVERGAIPTVCVFRPLQGTDLADAAPPDTHAMVPLFQHLYRACLEHGLPVGVAPNVHVSLVLLPDEARWLVQDPEVLRATAPRERRHRLAGRLLAAYLRARTAWHRGRARRQEPAP